MNRELLAAILHGREYTNEITYAERAAAKAAGLVVLFGGSDDIACFHGAIEDEASCYGGGDIYVNRDGILEAHECGCVFCGYKEKQKAARKIEAIWAQGGSSWTYKTDIPHATFNVMEDGQTYCRGIVFAMSDLEAAHA